MVDGVLAGLERLRDELVDAGRAPSRHTVASYVRRWRQWALFADTHDVDDLPADPVHVAAFVLARHEAGVGAATIEANLSAIRWVHGQRVGDLTVTDQARAVLAALRRREGTAPPSPAPVLSVGALLAMACWQPPGTRGFSTRVVRLYTGAPPRQLAGVTAAGIEFGPDDAWVVLECPAVRASRSCAALAAARFRFVRGRSPLECPVRALRALVTEAGDGPLFSPHLLGIGVRGFDPMTSRDGTPVRLGLRDRAVICVGYGGALRVEEIAQARVENLEVVPAGYRLALEDPKATGSGERQAVLLERRDDALDPVSALDDWLAVRGDADGPLFPAVHHRGPVRSGVYEGLTAGSVREVIGDRAQAVGLDGVSGYSLRRSWATHQYLTDPMAIAWVSARLRHARVEVTTRYIEDLHLELLDPVAVLSADVIAAAPGTGRPTARKDLGFAARPLDALVAEAARLSGQRRELAPSTARTFANAWRMWCRFAAEHAIAALPADPAHVAAFVASRLTSGGSPATMLGYLSGIRHAHEYHGVLPTGGFRLAHEVVAGHRRVHPWAPNRAPVLTIDGLRRMATAALTKGDDLALAVVCVGYAGALRLDDMFWARLEHVEDHPAGAVLRFVRSKGNPSGRRAEGVLLVARPDELDPVAALARLRAARPSVGPLLSRADSPGRPICKDTIVYRLRRAGRWAGLDVVPTGNSLRRSWATHAYESGLDLFTISRHLRHANPDLTKTYVQTLSSWVNNPAEHLARHHHLMTGKPHGQ